MELHKIIAHFTWLWNLFAEVNFLPIFVEKFVSRSSKHSSMQLKLFLFLSTFILKTLFIGTFFCNNLLRKSDLKPENVLISENGYLKLSDFGFAKRCPTKTYTFCGTLEYLAPEIIQNKGHGKAVDWWTFGIFLYELLVGAAPFTGDDPMEINRQILTGRLSFQFGFDLYLHFFILKSQKRDAKSLIKRLLQEDLSKRIGNLKGGVSDIKNHRFFKDFNWDDLMGMKLRAPYIPLLKYSLFVLDFESHKKSNRSISDTSQFPEYTDPEVRGSIVKSEDDPFSNW